MHGLVTNELNQRRGPETAAVVAALARIAGAEHVLHDAVDLAPYARSTAPRGTRPWLTVRPADREQVQAIVRCAAAHGFSLYPISRGRNWGYGDACAPLDDCVILDLSRMDRIIEVNEELAYVVLEPGVTQGQLADHLRSHAPTVFADCCGAGPDASIVGNVLERGFGLSPYGDRFAHSCNFEVVLADGSVVHTGHGAYPNARAAHLWKWGIGPALDGVFTQANLGIVTRMTMWLMPKPAGFRMFFAALQSDADIGAFIEALRRLRLAGSLNSQVHVFNAMRVLGMCCRFPWDAADGTEALETAAPILVRKLLDKHGIPAWAASGALYGSRAETAASARTIRRAFRGIRGLRVLFFDDRRFALASAIAHLLPRRGRLAGLRSRILKLRLPFDMLLGQPSRETITGSHWRARRAADASNSPASSGTGMIWVSPIAPATGDAVGELQQIGTETFHEFGFEYQVTYTLVCERAVCGVMSIQFDRDDAAETARAQSCHDRLLARLLAAGFVPYRGALTSMPALREAAPQFFSLAETLKRGLDPHDIIAPGRYLHPLCVDANRQQERSTIG